MNISHSIHMAINQVDFLKLQGLLLSQALQQNPQIISTIACDIIIKAEAKRARSNLIKYEVHTLQKGIIKILKFVETTFGREILFSEDKIGKNFLDYAVCRGYKEVLQKFYEENKVNSLSGDDYIMEGAKFNSFQCIKWLCEKGETLWRKNKSGQSAIDIARLNGAKDSEEILKENNQKNEKKLLLYTLFCGHHTQQLNSFSLMLNQENLIRILKYI